MASWQSAQPYTRSLLRFMAGFTFSAHGWQKLFGVLGGVNGHGATVHLFSLFGLAGVIETFGGGLILLGLYTRPAAFIAAGEMAVAYFLVHNRMGFWPRLNGGEFAVLYCFIFLYLSSAGAGALSLDRLLRKKS
jgi:putative oxidoreductase